MKVPHTIPKILLRAFTRKLNEEALQKSYEGRLLVSENPGWDESIPQTLSQQCLTLVVDEFLFYNKLLEYFNDLQVQDYEKRRAKWEADLAVYIEKKANYDRRMQEYEQAILNGDDPTLNFDDDDDDDDPNGDGEKANKGKPVEPEPVDAEFPEYEPISSILDHLKDDDRVHVIEEIDLDLVPFPLAVKIIPDDHYWERQARDRWTVFDITDHAKSWRRLFMEKHAWDAIEKFHPADDDMDKLIEELTLVGGEVIRLKIQNLIPICFGTPAKDMISEVFDGDNEFGADPEFDAGFGDEEMFDDPDDQTLEMSEEVAKMLEPKKKQKGSGQKRTEGASTPTGRKSQESDFIIPPTKRNPTMDRKDPSHLNFTLIMPAFTALKEMTITYEMVETGMDWEDRFFKFTDKDSLHLARALALCPTLEKFELLRSRVTGEQCKTLVREGLIKMPHLKILNLNYNRIGNDGARAVARLLIDEGSRPVHTIHTVRVARNRIRNKGGKALAYALTRNRHLAILDARLNSFGDPAGMDFGHALVKNTGLMALFLGANKLTEESAYIIGKMLYHNKSLKELDLSSNDFGKKGGEFLALGMRNNKVILRVDVRMCNIGLDFEYDVGLHLRKNRMRISAIQSILDGEDYYPNEVESAMLDLNEDYEEESDDDEEAQEEEQTEEEAEDEGDHDGDGDDDEGGGISGVAAAAFAAAGINSLEEAQLAMKDPEIAALVAKAVGVGVAQLKLESIFKHKKKSVMTKKTVSKVAEINNEKDVKVVKEPTQINPSTHAIS